MDRELLHKYFSGVATREEEKQISDWIEISEDNYKKYLRERKLWNILLLNSNDETVSLPRNNRKSLVVWKAAAIAAVVALIVSLSGIIQTSSDPAPGVHVISVPAGQRTQLILEDGTKVWLNARTILTYPASFAKNSRNVILDGEGYFEVNPDKDRPFIVQTENYNVNVLGTTINVYAYSNSTTPFELSLLSGKVSIEDNNRNQQDITLMPNEYVTEQEGVLLKNKITSVDRFRWKDGLICLDDEPFNRLMTKFSEYYDTKIVIKNETYNKYRCTGKFRMSDGIDYALRVLQRDVNFKYKRDEETHTITIF